MLLNSRKARLILLSFVIASLLSPIVSVATEQQQKKASGELKIEGNYIARLVLHRKDGHTEQFDEPAETVKLAVGEYQLQKVYLKNGYTYNSISNSTNNTVNITEKETTVLKVGAPLKQTVKVERQGPILQLSYDLAGVGGENYAVMRSARPAFTVFKGDKKVGSGEFEFG